MPPALTGPSRGPAKAFQKAKSFARPVKSPPPGTSQTDFKVFGLPACRLQTCSFRDLLDAAYAKASLRLSRLCPFVSTRRHASSQEVSLTSAMCGSTLPTPPRETNSMLLASHASQPRWSTVVTSAARGGTLPTPPCKAEKLRFRRRAAARYPCLCAELQIRCDRRPVHGTSGARPRATHALTSFLISSLSRR